MSPTKKRQTMGKMNRERELKERRDLKKEKKEERKAAAALGADAVAHTLEPEAVDGDPVGDSSA
jgi:hypothetical protein